MRPDRASETRLSFEPDDYVLQYASECRPALANESYFD